MSKVTKLIPKCYTRYCEEKAEYKWLPNKNKGYLNVCKEHYDLLIYVYDVEQLGEEDGLKVVRVIPETEVKDES